jgi:hypothetical protein
MINWKKQVDTRLALQYVFLDKRCRRRSYSASALVKCHLITVHASCHHIFTAISRPRFRTIFHPIFFVLIIYIVSRPYLQSATHRQY